MVKERMHILQVTDEELFLIERMFDFAYTGLYHKQGRIIETLVANDYQVHDPKKKLSYEGMLINLLTSTDTSAKLHKNISDKCQKSRLKRNTKNAK